MKRSTFLDSAIAWGPGLSASAKNSEEMALLFWEEMKSKEKSGNWWWVFRECIKSLEASRWDCCEFWT